MCQLYCRNIFSLNTINSTPIYTRLMRLVEEAIRRCILARVSLKQRNLVALYNESIAELDSIINEADRHKTKKIMNEDKKENLIKINAVKIEREKVFDNQIRYEKQG